MASRRSGMVPRVLGHGVVFSLVSVVGFAMATPIAVAGFVAWGPILLALADLRGAFFRRGDKSLS